MKIERTRQEKGLKISLIARKCIHARVRTHAYLYSHQN